MARPNYFDILEELSKNACEAVSIACGQQHPESRKVNCKKEKGGKESLCELRARCDKMICSLEGDLFADFIPPLQRDNIASLAHGFWRIISRAVEHYTTASARQSVSEANDEERLCVLLCEKLSENTAMLRKIKNPETTPSLTEFRKILREAGEGHSAYLSRIGAGTVPRSCAMRAFSSARLRFEISRCFDCLIEVMLGNI